CHPTRQTSDTGGFMRFVARSPLLFAAALAASSIVIAAGRSKPPINSSSGLALKGYDGVAYTTEGKPVRGQAQFQFTWNGATWQFASAENRDLFRGAPENYAPQFGGYCAWAVGHGYTSDGDPA